VRTLLKPGGLTYVEVLNAAGVGAQMSGEYWYGWDAPRHLFTFTPETLEKTLTEAGLEVTKIKTRVWDSFSWASTYVREEKTSEKLANRPSAEGGDYLKVLEQGVAARAKHLLKPLDGDLICCLATRLKE